MFITPVGLLIERSVLITKLGPDNVRKLINLMTHTRIDKRTKRPITTPLYSLIVLKGKQYVRFPRFVLDAEFMTAIGYKNVKIERVIDAPKIVTSAAKAIKAEYLGNALENQRIILDHLMANIYTPERRARMLAGCILHLKPGMGKTHVALQLMCTLGVKTMIIVPNKILANQWKEEFNEYITGATLGCYNGVKKVVADATIATVQSVRKWDSVLAEFKDAGLVIYDEVHEYCSDKSRNMFWAAQRECVIGLTGTPDERNDQLDVIYKMHVGPVISATKIPGFTYDEVKFTGNVNIIHYHGPDEYVQELRNVNGEMNCSGTLAMITKDPYRNRLIVDNIVRLIDSGIHVFVFSEYRDHLMTIHQLLKARVNVGVAFTNDVLMGGASTDEINDAYSAKDASVIFTTYMFSAVGISIERMNALVLATPRRSKMRQIAGRIMRRGSDYNKEREVVDIVDKRTFFYGQLGERRKVYRELGLRMTTSKHYADLAMAESMAGDNAGDNTLETMEEIESDTDTSNTALDADLSTDSELW